MTDKNLDKKLKTTYLTQVESDANDPNSIMGLGLQIKYAILPDLFYSTNKTEAESDDEFKARVDDLKRSFRPYLVDKLQEKLNDFYAWKEDQE